MHRPDHEITAIDLDAQVEAMVVPTRQRTHDKEKLGAKALTSGGA